MAQEFENHEEDQNHLVEGGIERWRLKDPRFRLLKPFRWYSRVIAGLFSGSSAFIYTMAKYIPIMAIVLLAASIGGFAIAPPIGILIVAAVGIIGLIAAVVKYLASGKVFENHEAHLKANKNIKDEIARLKAEMETELNNQKKLVEQAQRLGVPIDDLIDVKTVVPEKKPENFKDRVKALFKKSKSKLGTAEAVLDNGISIFGSIGVAFAAVLAVFATIGAFMGQNIFSVGLLATLGAVTGLTGVGGAIILGVIVAAVCGILLANKFFWKAPLKRMHTNMKEDSLKNAFVHKEVHDELDDIQRTNRDILVRINEKLETIAGGTPNPQNPKVPMPMILRKTSTADVTIDNEDSQVFAGGSPGDKKAPVRNSQAIDSDNEANLDLQQVNEAVRVSPATLR